MDDNMVRRMRFACWITKATDTHSEYEILTFIFTAIMAPRTRLYVTFYVLCFVLLLNPLKPELNPICYLLALLGAHHFLHVSRIKVNNLALILLTWRKW